MAFRDTDPYSVPKSQSAQANALEIAAIDEELARRKAEREREAAIRENASYLKSQTKAAEDTLKEAEKTRPELATALSGTEEAWAEDDATAKKKKWFGLSNEPTPAAVEAQSRLDTHKADWTAKKSAIDEIDTRAAEAKQQKEGLVPFAEAYDEEVRKLDAKKFAETHAKLTGQTEESAPPADDIMPDRVPSIHTGGVAAMPLHRAPQAPAPEPAPATGQQPPTPGQPNTAQSAITEPKTPDNSKWDDADKAAWRGMSPEKKKAWITGIQSAAQAKTDATMAEVAEADAQAPQGELNWIEESRRAWNRTSPAIASRLASATRLLYNITPGGPTPPEWTDHVKTWADEQFTENKASDSLSQGQYAPANPRWWLANGIPAAAELVADLGLATLTGPAAPYTFMALGGAKMAGEQYADATEYYQKEQGLSLEEAEDRAIGEALVVGTIGTVLEKLPATEFLTKNKLFTGAVRNILTRRGIAGFSAEALTETAQELTAMAADAGFRGNPKAFDRWQERLASSFTLGGAMGAGADITMGAAGDFKARAQKQTIDSENATLAGEAAAVDPATANAAIAEKWNAQEAANYKGDLDADLAGWDATAPETSPADAQAHPYILQTKVDQLEAIDTDGMPTVQVDKIEAAKKFLTAALEARKVTPEMVSIVSTLSDDKGGAITRAEAEIAAARAEVDALDAAGPGTVWNPADHEARLAASAKLNAALKAKIALGAPDTGTPQQAASAARLMPLAREIASRPDAPADPNGNGKPNGSSQRQIALAIAKVAQGIPLTTAEMNLRSGSVTSPGPIFQQDKATGRVTIKNPETARSLTQSSPILGAAYAAYEAGTPPAPPAPTNNPAPTGGQKPSTKPANQSAPGQYRVVWKRDGQIIGESPEYSAPDSAIAEARAAEQPLPDGVQLGSGVFREVETIAEPITQGASEAGEAHNLSPEGSTPSPATPPDPAPVETTPKQDMIIAKVRSLAAPFAALFPGGVRVVPESKNSGGLSLSPDGELVVSLADTDTQIQSEGNLKAKFVEELIHAVLVRANVNADAFFKSLPTKLRATVKAAYESADSDYVRGHEALRMFFQGKIKLSDTGEITWADSGGQLLSEQTSPALATQIRDIIRTLLAEFKKLRATLAGNQPAIDILNQAERELRKAISSLPKNEDPQAPQQQGPPANPAREDAGASRQDRPEVENPAGDTEIDGDPDWSVEDDSPQPVDETDLARGLTEKEYAITQLEPGQIRPFLRGEMLDQPAGAPRVPDKSLEKIAEFFEATGRDQEAAIIRDEMERRAMDEDTDSNMATTREGKYELLEAIRSLGGIPTTDANLQGEINTIREGRAAKEVGLFNRNADALDILRSNLVDYGFDFATPAELLDSIDARLSGGKPVYGTPPPLEELRSQASDTPEKTRREFVGELREYLPGINLGKTFWVAADGNGDINAAFQDAESGLEYFGETAHRGEWLWRYESGINTPRPILERGVAEGRALPPRVKTGSLYEFAADPSAETPSEAGEIPQFTAEGKAFRGQEESVTYHGGNAVDPQGTEPGGFGQTQTLRPRDPNQTYLFSQADGRTNDNPNGNTSLRTGGMDQDAPGGVRGPQDKTSIVAPLSGKSKAAFETAIREARSSFAAIGAAVVVNNEALPEGSALPWARYSPSQKRAYFYPSSAPSSATPSLVRAYVREELIHAAQFAVAEREYLRDPKGAQSPEDYIARTHGDIVRELAGSEAGRRLLLASIALYRGGISPTVQGTPEIAVQMAESDPSYVWELGRQLIQLKQQGQITEGKIRAAYNAVTTWFRKALGVLRDASKQSPSPILDETIRQTIDLLNGKGTPLASQPAPTGHAQPLSEPVRVPWGEEIMGRMKSQKAIMAPGGEATRVAEIFPQGIRPVFRMELAGGQHTRVTADHLWAAKVRDVVQLMTTAEIASAVWAGEKIQLPVQP